MRNWIENLVIAAVVAGILAGMYLTWRDCSAAGGTTVRGLVGLHCIHR